MNTPRDVISFAELYSQTGSKNLDRTESPITSPPKRLGIYYENLVESLIKNKPEPIDYKRNIQVKRDKTTLGEFDFIGSNEASSFHLECAIKFYLRVGPGDQLSDYIGPGKKDRLDIKWKRLLDHQLPLSTTMEGISACREHDVISPKQVLLLQGYLFHPFKEGVPENMAQEINPNHLNGWWLKQSDVVLLGEDLEFAQMHKPYWLTPNISQAMNIEELKERIQDLNFPILITRGIFRNNQWQEHDRGFIVPDAWQAETKKATLLAQDSLNTAS
jgi:hypothetical protein